MEKFSVRRPFTILVAVVAVIILGFVSVSNMTTDLLPSMNLPYMIVITPYPGASPERVEQAVSEPMERALGTISHVKNVYSVSAENYSLTQLEFEDGTNMDSAMVKVSSAVEQTRGTLPDMVGTPSILEISMDMIATMYLAVSRDGNDIYELSEYVNDELVPYFERQEGVASVVTIGTVEKSVQVELNGDKINDLNDEILSKTNIGLRDAKKQLDDAKAQVAEGQRQLEIQEQQFGSLVAGGLMGQVEPKADEIKINLQTEIIKTISELNKLQARLNEMGSPGDSMAYNISGAMANFQEAYKTAGTDLKKAREDLDKARSDAEKVIREGAQKANETGASYENVGNKVGEVEKAFDELEKDLEELIPSETGPDNPDNPQPAPDNPDNPQPAPDNPDNPGNSDNPGGSDNTGGSDNSGNTGGTDNLSPDSGTQNPDQPPSPDEIGTGGRAITPGLLRADPVKRLAPDELPGSENQTPEQPAFDPPVLTDPGTEPAADPAAPGESGTAGDPVEPGDSGIAGDPVEPGESGSASQTPEEKISEDFQNLDKAAQELSEAINKAAENTAGTIEYMTAEQTRNRLQNSAECRGDDSEQQLHLQHVRRHHAADGGCGDDPVSDG